MYLCIRKLKNMNKKRKQIIDILNAVKSKQRSDEIEAHTKPITYGNLTRNKKKYTRKIKHKQIFN